LHSEAAGQIYNNLAVHHGGGGIENVNTVISGLNEMLLQSFQNNILVFASWPSNVDAKFGDLLAYGAFKISSLIVSNSVQYLVVVSQKGRDFTFTNPWQGQQLVLYRNGQNASTLSGGKITVKTSPSETISIAPAGTTYAQILDRMNHQVGEM